LFRVQVPGSVEILLEYTTICHQRKVSAKFRFTNWQSVGKVSIPADSAAVMESRPAKLRQAKNLGEFCGEALGQHCATIGGDWQISGLPHL